MLDEGVNRDDFRRTLAEDDVHTSVHYPRHTASPSMPEPAAQLPITGRYANRTVTLPLFAGMSRSQQDRVFAAIMAALDGP